MEIIAIQRYVRTSPKKLRLVADAIRRSTPQVALSVLPQMNLSASEPMAKVIRTALANARQRGLADDNLVFKEIQISQGPTMKRGQPVSRGRWHPIKKRTSHIRVVLQTTNSKSEIPSSKKTQKSESVKSRKEKNS